MCARFLVWREVDPIGNPEYTYVQVANAIAARYKGSYQTLRHGIDVLRTRGLVITRHGRGTFVTPPEQPDPPG